MTRRTFAVSRRERAGAALNAGRGPRVPRGRKSGDAGPAQGRRARGKRKRGKR